MIIVSDIGNTQTKFCIYKKNQLLSKTLSFPTKLILSKKIKNKLNFLKRKPYAKCTVLFSSVVPSKYKILKNLLNKNFKIKCIELKKINLKEFINIKVNRKQIGSDRIANAIAVSNKKKNFIIIDFGTATTFDILLKNNYIGGIISPGVELSLKTLIKKASLIKKVKLKKISKVIGKNTKSAVRSGFFWGYIGLIDNLIKLIQKQNKNKFKIIITGGLAYLFVNSLKYKCSIVENLTMLGLLKVSLKKKNLWMKS